MRDISQSQWVNCDLARRYVGLNLSQQVTTPTALFNPLLKKLTPPSGE